MAVTWRAAQSSRQLVERSAWSDGRDGASASRRSGTGTRSNSAHLRDDSAEPPVDCTAVRDDNEFGVGSDIGDGLEEMRTAPSSPQHGPDPEVASPRPAPPRPPRAEPEGEIEHDDGVSASQSGFQDVIRSEISIHDPTLSLRHGSLTIGPLARGQWFERRIPVDLVELDHLGTGPGAKRRCEHGLASSTSPQHHDTIHLASVTQPHPRSRQECPNRVTLPAFAGSRFGHSAGGYGSGTVLGRTIVTG